MTEEIKYSSAKWFNPEISKLLKDHNQYKITNFLPNTKIKTEICKTNRIPKYSIEPQQNPTIKQVGEALKFYDSEIKKNKTPTQRKTLITKTKKLFERIGTVIRVKRYTLDLSSNQKDTIQGWIKECKKVYNFCVEKHNKDNHFFDKGYKSVKKTIFDEFYGNDTKPASYDVLTDEIRSFESNLKSCRSNLKNGHVKHFTIKPKLKKFSNYSLMIPYKSIYNHGIFKTLVGDIKNFNLEILPNHDSRLYYNAYEDSYTLNIPTDIECKDLSNRESVCAIDPGESKFISFWFSILWIYRSLYSKTSFTY